MKTKLKELKTRLTEINDLESAAALLDWDQNTYMPPGGAPARARQTATLERLAHEKFTDAGIGKLLDDLRPYEESAPYDSDEASLIRVTRRDYERAIKVPPAFVAEFSDHRSASFQAWAEARPANDFAKVRPYLEKTLDLSRRLANFFPGYEHIADPLIDYADYGMKASTVRATFAELREQLVPIVQAITAQPPADDACLRQTFPEAQQWAFGLEVVKRLGYDFERGRQDKAPHPFTTEFSIGDVRITTRVKENNLGEALFGTMHESGHGMYEQGVRTDLEGTPLAGGTSSGVHESQSRLWENVVGRSRGFWRFFYPRLQDIFPDQLEDVELETFYRAINKVERSLIRTDADEVTYNLHILLRFDFELRLLEGDLTVRDLPDAWRERFSADMGIIPPDDRDGVLQDIHWYAGGIGGAFQGYTLGNILSAQFFEQATQAHPEIESEIEAGKFSTLHNWLKESIYQHGRKYTPSELVERVTGGPLNIEPYIRYLCDKYGELYGL
ncbi:MAG: carboxypeptidase M32 [Chloroflexi bacterium]|nr:MAG: carboxypeptidase [Anaerolineaceae bacterium 4572_32.2]RLC81201.1 MAG: carboxypeptidase M32 [Chloroflexota bacterium]RLC85971.1 MAG: carboxypeptidase M32 [Chloroflexota bacterium]HEY72835.1 carboxypeptidase M32 [Thermoflexia bacterium]